MLRDYLPILLQVIVAVGFAAFALVLSVILGRVGKRNAVKDSPYECGMLPLGEAQPRFSVKFYLVAMLFMYPWAVVYRDYVAQFNPWIIFGSMLGFVSILMVGFVYALKKGALDWKR